jgi:kynurenine formamidase
MHKASLIAGALILCAATLAAAQETPEIIEQSQQLVPSPPWGEDDQIGMANAIGPGTWMRCAAHLTAPGARSYELSHIRSNTMPLSPFGVPLKYRYRPTVGIPGTMHAFNGEEIESGEPGAQGTQMDGLGHFAVLPEAWDGQGEFPADQAVYYNGLTQEEVKPTPDSELLKLGMENVPPIVTSAILLDAVAHNGSKALAPGELVTAADIEAMLEAQGLSERGILPGDVVYIYTGWSENWRDPAGDTPYYTMGPGLSYDAARYLADKRIVLVALDNPFTDPVNEGALRGEAGPPEGTPEGLPFVIHHFNLVEAGIHQIQNAKLDELAADRVWTSCTMILPLRSRGASGSPVRPVAIGAPRG